MPSEKPWKQIGRSILLLVAVILASFFITWAFMLVQQVACVWIPAATSSSTAIAAPPSLVPAESTTTPTTYMSQNIQPRNSSPQTRPMTTPKPQPSSLPSVNTLPFVYTFNTNEIFYEAGSENQSSSRYWFLDSGAELISKNNIGATIQGDLSSSDPWKSSYAHSNPTDTDNGLHPQNIFRLVTRGRWTDISEQAFFDITKDNLSASENRNESNGLLLMSRYQDHNTLYYAGIRVDGRAVIKKKYHGTYYTMAERQIFPGTYDARTSPNLLPHNEWIGLRTDTKTTPNGAVNVTLYIQLPGEGSWAPVLSAVDDGTYNNTPPITAAGQSGIRTDFMDVLFKNFRIDAI